MLGSSSNGADAAEKDKQRQRQEKLAAWKNKQGLAAPAAAPVQPKKEEAAWCTAAAAASSRFTKSSKGSHPAVQDALGGEPAPRGSPAAGQGRDRRQARSAAASVCPEAQRAA